ncbi:STAS-like domain-containing protein [Empedobacter brevis]|uniref:STAS-like domain-containing protein n=1 Tax=Empedobacter brevis TaxID=247 RepID=UPI00333F9714
MKTIAIKKYGPIISDKKIGDKIINEITSELEIHKKIEIDLKDVITMATFCAKQIFGQLYIKLGQEEFFENIKISHASNDMKIIINMGIQNAIEEE